MKEKIITLLIALSIVGCAFAADKHRGVKLTSEQRKVVESVIAGGKKSAKGDTPPKYARIGKPATPPQRLSQSGSMLQGYAIKQNGSDGISGWYEFRTDGSMKLLWEYMPDYTGDPDDKPEFPFNVGFLRQGKIYGFYSEVLLFWLIGGHGVFNLDGTMESYEYYPEMNTDMSQYVSSCAYDPVADIAYVYTLNEDATAYQFQKVNPETWEFTVINNNVPLEDIAIGFCYNPVDCKFYGVTTDARFVNVDVTTGKPTRLSRLSLGVSTMCQGLVYSPIDKCFYYIFNNGYGCAALYSISTEDYHEEYVADLENVGVVDILVTEDGQPSSEAPTSAEVVWVTMDGAENHGTADLVLPSEDYGGNPLSGAVTVTATVDNATVGTVTGQPGQTVSMIVSDVPSGMQTFLFTPSCNGVTGIRTEYETWVGYDTPGTPYDIVLEEGHVTWDMPYSGVHGGYVNRDELTYNVYINGEKNNTEPVLGMVYDFTMPEDYYKLYGASVEAVNHGLVSELGYSNNIRHGSPIPMPVTIIPTEEQNYLCSIESQNDRASWKYNAQKGCFRCSTIGYDGDEREEWLIMPPMVNTVSSDKLIEVSFDIEAEVFDDPTLENISVYVCPESDLANRTRIGEFNNIPGEYSFRKMSAFFVYNADEPFRVAFMTRKNPEGNYISLKNIKIELSEVPSTLPAAATNLKVTPFPLGQLKVDVSFTLPVKDAAGRDLPAGTGIDYTVGTNAETRTAKGTPGQQVNLTMNTVQGLNTIYVKTSDHDRGYRISTDIFTGPDIPAPLRNVTVTPSADLKSMTVKWEACDEGMNGGYVDPATVTYTIYTQDEEGYWEELTRLGTEREFVYTPELPTDPQLSVAEIGILTENERGHSGTVYVAYSVLGTPFSLPLIEDFSHGDPKYHPMIYHGEDTGHNLNFGFARFAYPYYVSEPTPYGDAAFILEYFDEAGKAMLTIPPVSTIGAKNTAVEVPIFCSWGSGKVTVYGEAYGTGMIKLGEYVDNENEGWVKKRFFLPETLKNKDWLSVSIEAEVDENNYIASVADYRIMDFLDRDMSLIDASAPLYPIVGKTYELTAKAENVGITDLDAPVMKCILTSGEKVVGVIEMTPDKDMVETGTYVNYTGEWNVTADQEGELKCTFAFGATDQNSENDSVETTSVVSAGDQYVVSDLRAVRNDNGAVQLTWTDPQIDYGFQGFENFAPFTFGDSLGDFDTIDEDGENTNNFIDITLPNELEPRAWQVWSESTMTQILDEAGSVLPRDLATAATGDKFAVSIVPYSIVMFEGKYADDWMISPEVMGGTTIKFMMSGSSTYDEVEVYTSEWSNGIWDMEMLDRAICLDTQWRQFEFTIPENARYFALRHVAPSDYGYFVKIDDIEYVPAASPTAITGYDIYRNGQLIAQNAHVFGSYSDVASVGSDTYYNVVPVLRQDADITHGLLSNTAYVGVSGVGIVNAESDVYVRGGVGEIKISGLSGQNVNIFTPDAISLYSGSPASDKLTVAATPGIYIVKADKKVVKVRVR